MQPMAKAWLSYLGHHLRKHHTPLGNGWHQRQAGANWQCHNKLDTVKDAFPTASQLQLNKTLCAGATKHQKADAASHKPSSTMPTRWRSLKRFWARLFFSLSTARRSWGSPASASWLSELLACCALPRPPLRPPRLLLAARLVVALLPPAGEWGCACCCCSWAPAAAPSRLRHHISPHQVRPAHRLQLVVHKCWQRLPSEDKLSNQQASVWLT